MKIQQKEFQISNFRDCLGPHHDRKELSVDRKE